MNTGRGRPKEDQEVKTTIQVGHEDAESPEGGCKFETAWATSGTPGQSYTQGDPVSTPSPKQKTP